MKRVHAVVAVFAACLLVPFAGSAAGPPDATCPQDTMLFTGTARDLTVPADGFCQITGATITRDLIQLDGAGADVVGSTIGRDVVFGNFAGALILDSHVGRDVVAGGEDSGAAIIESTVGRDFVGSGESSGTEIGGSTIGRDVRLTGGAGSARMEASTIGHDFFASKPGTVQTGQNGPDTPGGVVHVGHDFVIEGSPGLQFVFDGLCQLDIGRDLRVTGRTVTLGIGLGSHCVERGQLSNVVGRDLVVTGNTAASGFFGPSSIDVVDDIVGRDLVVTGNTAVPGGELEVSGNRVTRDATCAANTPAITVNVPNSAGHSNTCG